MCERIGQVWHTPRERGDVPFWRRPIGTAGSTVLDDPENPAAISGFGAIVVMFGFLRHRGRRAAPPAAFQATATPSRSCRNDAAPLHGGLAAPRDDRGVGQSGFGVPQDGFGARQNDSGVLQSGFAVLQNDFGAAILDVRPRSEASRRGCGILERAHTLGAMSRSARDPRGGVQPLSPPASGNSYTTTAASSLPPRSATTRR